MQICDSSRCSSGKWKKLIGCNFEPCKIEPKELPSSSIPCLLNAHTQKLEILVIALS